MCKNGSPSNSIRTEINGVGSWLKYSKAYKFKTKRVRGSNSLERLSRAKWNAPTAQKLRLKSCCTWRHFEGEVCHSLWSHVRKPERDRCPDVAADARLIIWLTDYAGTLVQSVTEGHLSQLHLRPRAVQYLPAPLERTEDALTLQLGFGTHIEPETERRRRSHSLVPPPL